MHRPLHSSRLHSTEQEVSTWLLDARRFDQVRSGMRLNSELSELGTGVWLAPTRPSSRLENRDGIVKGWKRIRRAGIKICRWENPTKRTLKSKKPGPCLDELDILLWRLPHGLFWWKRWSQVVSTQTRREPQRIGWSMSQWRLASMWKSQLRRTYEKRY